MTLTSSVRPLRVGDPVPPVVPAPSAAPVVRTGLVRLRTSTDNPRRRALSEREVEVLRLIAAGGTKEEISRRLGLSPSTVSRHMSRTYQALGARNAAHAVALAHGSGLIAPQPLPPAPSVSHRERQVLAGLAHGLTTEQVAECLSLSGETVKVHLRHIYRKLGVSCRANAVNAAINRRLLAVVVENAPHV